MGVRSRKDAQTTPKAKGRNATAVSSSLESPAKPEHPARLRESPCQPSSLSSAQGIHEIDLGCDASLGQKRHRGERWGDSWQQGSAPSKEEGQKATVSLRKGLGRRCRKEGTCAAEVLSAKKQRPAEGDAAPLKSDKESLEHSERLAQLAVESQDHSLERVLAVLRELQVPANFSRKNVMPVGSEYIRGMLLGLYSYGGTVGVSAKTTEHPWLTRLLIGALRVVAPDFPFSSIQLNYNYASKPHIDKNNLGTSFILGLGDYSGGELWAHDEDDGQEVCTLEGDEDVSAYYHVGRTLKGQLLQIRDSWTIFDGNKLHFTKPFQGERYSLIFFTSDRYASSPDDVRAAMGASGFDFNWNAENLEVVMQDKLKRRHEIARQVAKERAREEQNKLLKRGRCNGRVWASAWGLRCTAVCVEGSDLCGSHLDKNRWKTHGRMDGALPEKKRDEMAFWQRKNLEAGKRPPVREGATFLVPIPEWPETDYLRERMKTYGEYRLGQQRKKLGKTS